MRGYEVRHRNRRAYVLFELDAEECRAVASSLPPGGCWFDNLVAAADELDTINGADR